MHRICLAAILLLFIGTHVAGAAEERGAGAGEPQPRGTLTAWQGAAFGTTYRVKIVVAPGEELPPTLERELRESVRRLNAQMSLWDEASELSRFNRNQADDWFPVSADVVRVVDAALQMRATTNGAFDPTVRPLLSLWSFGPGHRPQQVPADKQIADALQLAGAVIETRLEPQPALHKHAGGVEIDLNAIAKGFAVDVFAERVGAAHPLGFLIEIGGEVRAEGVRPDGGGWRIAIEKPVAGERIAGWAIELDDASLATSGDYRNYFEADGRRYSHTLDPRTGRPITHNLASVSVIADDCMTADAWATALMVLGPDEGYHLAMQENIAALFLIRDGAGYSARRTAGFPDLIPLAQSMPETAAWSTFLIAAVVFGLAIAGMAVGVIVSNRRLRGSCGGLNGLRDEQGHPLCDACTTPAEECDEFRQQVAASRAAARDT